MNTSDIATMAVAMQQAKTQASIEAVMLRKQHEMDMQLINMLTEAADQTRSAAPEGMGKIVDKTA